MASTPLQPATLLKPPSRRRERLRFIGLLLLWALLVCYPNPFVIISNLARYAVFPIDPEVIRILPRLPDNPREIETFVLSNVSYRYDWDLYKVPWYVPSAWETALKQAGDCEGRAFLVASILAAKGISYRIEASPVHMWVDYPGKRANRIENEKEAYIRKVDGRWDIRLPNLSEWRSYLVSQQEMWWDTMPPARKALLVAGWGLLILWRWRVASRNSLSL